MILRYIYFPQGLAASSSGFDERQLLILLKNKMKLKSCIKSIEYDTKYTLNFGF